MKNALGYKFEKKKKETDAKSQMSNKPMTRGGDGKSNSGAPWSGIGANNDDFEGRNRKNSGFSKGSYNKNQGNNEFRKSRKSFNNEEGTQPQRKYN